MKLYFESQDVIVLEKPAGYLSVPSRLGQADPRPVAGIIAQKQWGRLFPVHRLDFEVAGLLIFARNPKAQAQLHKVWESDDGVEKTYRALSNPNSHSTELLSGAWQSQIAQGKKRSFIAPHGKSSLTRYQMLEPGVWNLSPVTGRRHQLRLEMSRHGFPILGDVLYGGQSYPHIQEEIALIAYKIVFNKKTNLQLPDHLELLCNWQQWKEKFKL